MPAPSTVSLWLSLHPEFSEQYRQSYESNLVVEAYSMRGMIDEVDESMVAIAKLREQIAHRKWELAIQFPKKYGPKPEPVVVTTSGVDVSKLTNEELDLYVDLLAKMKKNE
jgi:hypothetical protein